MDRLSDDPVISIIDDDESVRTGMASLVRSLGLTAHTFVGADEFLQSHRLDDTSCLILDVQMPGMSGLELQERLVARGCRSSSSPPIPRSTFATAHLPPAPSASSGSPSPPRS